MTIILLIKKALTNRAFFIFLVLHCTGFVTTASGQSVNLTFGKDTVTQNGNTYSFNTVVLRNSTASTRKLTIATEVPEGWQLLFDNRRVFELAPNQTLSLPLRLAAGIQSASGVYPVRLFLQVSGDPERTTYPFMAIVGANSRWRASLLKPNLVLSKAHKAHSFQLLLSNKGNSAEELNILVNTSLSLDQGKNRTVKLAAGKDTLLTYSFALAAKMLDDFKNQELTLQITDKKKENQLLLQKVSTFGTVFSENPSGWYNFPMSLEFVAQNVTNEQKSLYVNSNGKLDLGKGRDISFNYRTDNFNSQVDGSSRYAFLSYRSKQWLISAGDQSDFGEFLIDGLGARLAYDNGRGYRAEVLGINSRIGDAKILSGTQAFNFGGNQQLENQTIASFDKENQINSFLNKSTYELNWNKYHHLILRAGLSTEEFYSRAQQSALQQSFAQQFRKNGSSFGVNYQYYSPRITARFGLTATDVNYPGINRGLLQSNNEFTLQFKQSSIGVLFDYNERQLNPALDTGSLKYRMLGGRIAEYGLKTGWKYKRGYVTLITSMVSQMHSSSELLPINSFKLNFNTGMEIGKGISASFSGNMLRNYVSKTDWNALNEGNIAFNQRNPGVNQGNPVVRSGKYSLNAYGTLSTKNYGLFARLDDGPSYYFDFINYLNNGYSTRRLQIAPYYERSFFKELFHFRLQMDYTSDNSLPAAEFMARGDLSLNLNDQGLSFRVFGAKNVRATPGNRSDYMSLSIRKSFRVPLPGIRRFVTMKVQLFKDGNANGIYDTGDELIPDASLMIASQQLLTNKKGEIAYKNIPPGAYTIDLSQVNNIKGWRPANGFQQTFEVRQNSSFYLPFRQSQYLSGKLNVQKDPHSNRVFRPGNIRIMISNSKGESFSTLTTENGGFFMNLPQDTYKVRINTDLFEEDFRLLEDTFNADLLHKNSEHIVFELRERKRQINIRKQN